jgi:amino acid adenylation domain-containing protein
MSQLSDPFPLSFAQQRLWLLDRLVPNSPLYNIASVTYLNGYLNVAALAGAFQHILERHEVLRSVFGEEKGQPVQWISLLKSLPLAVIDLAGLQDAVREREAERLLENETKRPFDLRRGPLMRVLLLRLSEQLHQMALTLHHIASDGWSGEILYRELTAFYNCALAGCGPQLPALPIQYVDFAVWQRDWLRGDVLERQLAFWRERLRDLPSLLPLPTDRPRSLIQSHYGRTYRFAIPAVIGSGIKVLARSHGVTLFTVMLACFNVLLYRYTNQSDLAVGAPVANRNRREIEDLIGFFVNLLVLRADLSGNPPFTSVLSQLGKVVVEAFSWQDLPFEKLIEDLHPERTLSHTPLFQVVLSQTTPGVPLTLHGLDVHSIETGTQTAKFDLSLGIEDGEDGLQGAIEYRSDLFDATTILRMSAHLERILERAVVEPNFQTGDLQLLAREELAQIAYEFNDTDREWPLARPLILLFEDQADRTPEAIAVISNQGQWSYRDLDYHATRLSHRLRQLGVGPDIPVAVFMERTFEMLVAIIGILKAGGAYLGLDLLSPQERLGWILEDSGVAVVLTQGSLLEKLPPTRKTLLCLDPELEILTGADEQRLESLISLENLHCLVYTSGSTGLPKGTLATGRNYLNLSLWYVAFSQHGTHTRSLLATGINWDASFRNYFTALLAGGATVLADNGPYDPNNLLKTIKKHQVTVATMPMSLVHGVIEAARADDFQSLASLEYLHLGGEAVVSSKLRDWLHSPNCSCKLSNIYGLTETSDVSTGGLVDLAELDRLETIPVGRPLQNHRVYILNPFGRVQPMGVQGEICIGGPEAITRGYLNRLELTAEKFVPDPFGDGARLYKTGDLGRVLCDGRLEYVGRSDFQVKIRGMRIELGEIEEQLRHHPAVQEAVAVVKEMGADDKRLVAYICPKPGQTISVAELNSFLRSRVPDFMLPSAFVLIGKVPLGASGKINRKALPDPDWGKVLRTRAYVAPQTPDEEMLAQLFAELLKLDRVGREDHFFELGGHSLLALQLISRIRDAFGVELPLQKLFQAPTVGKLAPILGEEGVAVPVPKHWSIRRVERKRDPLRSIVVEMKPSGSQPPIFCVHPAMGNVLAYLDLARALPAEQPFYALQSPDPRDFPNGFETLEEMATAYCEAVRGVSPQGPYVLAGWSQGGAVAFEMAQHLDAEKPGAVVQLALIDPTLPGLFDQAGDDAMILALFARDLAGAGGCVLDLSLEELRELEGQDQWSYFLLKARIGKALPEGLSAEQMKCLYQTFKMNVRIFQAYKPRPCSAAASLFVPQLGLSGVREAWSGHLNGPIEVHEIPGDHRTLLQPPNVEILARCWSRTLMERSTPLNLNLNRHPEPRFVAPQLSDDL